MRPSNENVGDNAIYRLMGALKLEEELLDGGFHALGGLELREEVGARMMEREAIREGNGAHSELSFEQQLSIMISIAEIQSIFLRILRKIMVIAMAMIVLRRV